MPVPSHRRRSTSSRAASLPLKELHAVAGHLLAVFERDELSEAQDRFLTACHAELEARNAALPPLERCHCRMCTPAAPMGWDRRRDPS